MAAMAALPPELLPQLRYLAAEARRMGGLIDGPPGPSAGWSEAPRYRDYASGDDLHQVDWAICARHDELVVRLRPPTVHQYCFVLLDASASMAAGTPPLFDLARRAAAAVACVALAETAQVGLVVFADRILLRRPLVGDQGQLARLLRFLQTLAPSSSATDLARAAEAFVRQEPRRGTTVVLSDFYDPKGAERGLEILRQSGCRPRMVRFYDPAAGSPDWLGDAEVWDVESGRCWQGVVTQRMIRHYRDRYQEHRQGLKDYAAGRRVPLTEIRCDLPSEEVLRKAVGRKR